MSGSDHHERSKSPSTAAAHSIVITTATDATEARRLARMLVEERLAGCVQLIEPIRSIYRWQGEIAEDGEVLLLIKSRHELFSSICERVRELHSYDTPELVQLPADAEAEYARWLDAATATAAPELEG